MGGALARTQPLTGLGVQASGPTMLTRFYFHFAFQSERLHEIQTLFIYTGFGGVYAGAPPSFPSKINLLFVKFNPIDS